MKLRHNGTTTVGLTAVRAIPDGLIPEFAGGVSEIVFQNHSGDVPNLNTSLVFVGLEESVDDGIAIDIGGTYSVGGDEVEFDSLFLIATVPAQVVRWQVWY
ncbi:MAG: hypothetical protein M0Q12_00210 [Synergistaceae bacterium]|jgi:hypothetical protein|nr:hypothetical protein [Synergistaceae bacterium]